MSTAARGFGSMDPDTARAIQRKGGQMAHLKGTGRQWTVEEAREAGRKGGLAGVANRASRDNQRAKELEKPTC